MDPMDEAVTLLGPPELTAMRDGNTLYTQSVRDL